MTMTKRLFIDLTLCDECKDCRVDCRYFYRPHATDHGMLALRERATMLLVCRHCENATCVAACRFEALERQADGALKRHNLRCVSCKCCSLACPFGTIYPDAVPFYETNCDLCVANGRETPPCVASCERGAVDYREVAAEEEDIHLVGDHLAVRARRWRKEDV
jgi:Fe-S-cluster-containing hydrogenase component 2